MTIAGFPDYAVSSAGRVKRLTSRTRAKAEAILKQSWRGGRSSDRGYLCVDLCRLGQKKRTVSVHVLVAEAFLSDRPTGKNPNHKDADRANNRASNLEWKTQSENVQHAYDLGLRDCRGEGNGQARLTTSEVIGLREASLTATRGFYATEARRLDVSETTIRDAVTGRTWSHLPSASEMT